ncbi:MAG: hypothetical protein KAW14_02175 [Candidatus Aegiribacteria sp.]|nr:hypothetical protein [Candidatus Aegiribacteria sp.]
MNHSSIRKRHGKYLPTALGMLIASGFLPSFTVSSQTVNDDDTGQNDSTKTVYSDLRTLFARTSVLYSNPQWQAFKMLWRKLDSFSSIDGVYSHGSSAEEANKFRSRFNIAFEELREVSEETGIDSVELALLEELSYARLDYLSYGSQLLLTRMMPPPVSEQTDSLLPQIEARIDTVIKLRECGLIGKEEMTIAFENMVSCIDTYCVLEVISRGIFYSSPVWSFRWPEEVSEIQTAFDSIRTASLNRIENDGEIYEGQYQETYDAFIRIENDLHHTITRLPALNDLLLDLELF